MEFSVEASCLCFSATLRKSSAELVAEKPLTEARVKEGEESKLGWVDLLLEFD